MITGEARRARNAHPGFAMSDPSPPMDRGPFDDAPDPRAARNGAVVLAVLLSLPAMAIWTWSEESRVRATYARIDTALPRGRGITEPVVAGEMDLSIRVRLRRETTGTRVAIDDHGWMLPDGTPERESTLGSIGTRISALHAANPTWKGEIEASSPTADAVPHTDTMAILDLFLAAGVKDVNFVGAPSSPSRDVGRRER